MAAKRPTKIIDAHHHFFDTASNDFQTFVRSLMDSDMSYLPGDYEKDVVQELQKADISLISSVHVEAMPDNGYDEAKWAIENARRGIPKVIVASANLAGDAADEELKLLAKLPQVVGIRWILDCVTEAYQPNTATHVAVKRHPEGAVDYLRASNGKVWKKFEAGYSLLSKYEYSFDLQCAPAQLLAATDLAKRYPNVPVILDHFGKPRDILLGRDKTTLKPLLKESELKTWREGMHELAKLPHVHVKISMLGYVIPGWCESGLAQQVLRDLVLEVVDLFGADRCMMALNWWTSASLSDSDSNDIPGPSPSEFVGFLSDWLSGYSDEDRDAIFWKTAQRVYRMT